MPRFKFKIFQRRINGMHRLHLAASCEESVRKAVEREALRYGTSMSFVVTVAVAEALGVPLQYESDYRDLRKQGAPRVSTNGNATTTH